MATHADDVHRLLAGLTDEPVRMLGCSMGAAIGLHLAVAHPDQLHTLIAHEPVTPWLLAAAALRGAPVVEFPGGHNGNLTHPAGYAAKVAEVLDAGRRSASGVR